MLGPVPLAAHACLINFVWLFYMLPYAIGLAGTIRVGNLLGEGDPARARATARTASLINVVTAAVFIACILAAKDVFPYVYVSEEAVAAMSSALAPAFLVMFSFDAVNMTIVGSIRGAGRQVFVTKLSVVQSYVVALPVAAGLAFYTDLGLLGIWIGLGSGVVTASLGGAWYLFYRLDWPEASELARKRAALG